MSDLIDRQAAIDAMMKLQTEDIEAYGASIPEGFDGDRAVAALKALPSAQPVAKDINVPVKDCISRQAAIDAITQYLGRIKRDFKQWEGTARIILDHVPSAQAGWIPVTERLPKKDGDYLVTTHSGQIARYIFIGGSSEEYWRRCATAWMSLPTPYREGGQE